MSSPGKELLELCAGAKEDVVLVAPFVKSAALERVLKAIPDEGTNIRCVARWRPEEIAAGACDIEIFDVIKHRPHARLFIHPLLHAKFFRVDDRCLLGSANLTQRALGWVTPANLELLLEAPAETPTLQRFERTLFSAAFEASETLRDEMAHAAKDFENKGLHATLLSEESISDDETAFLVPKWLPLCPDPRQLYRIYSGNADSIVRWTFESGRKDLEVLRIPSGLSNAVFHKYAAASIRQIPIIQHACEAASRNPVTPEEGQEIVSSEVDEQDRRYGLEQHWNIVKEWIIYFLPGYRGINALQRGTEL